MDTLRIVTLSRGGRPVPVLDLNDGSIYNVSSETFKHTPAPRKQVLASDNRRYGRTRIVGETHALGSVEWTALVAIDRTTQSIDVLTGYVERFLLELEATLVGRLLEFRPEGASKARSSFFEIAGPAEWAPGYEWKKYALAGFLEVQISIPVQPLVRWAPMTIRDGFEGGLEDWIQDSGSGAVTGAELSWADGAGVKGLRHIGRGYQPADTQVTAKFRTGSSVPTDFALGCIVRQQPDGDHLLGHVVAGAVFIYRYDHTSTYVYVASASAPTLASGSTYWMRIRTEARVVTVEFFTSPPTPLGTPAATVSSTLPVGDALLGGGDVGLRVVAPSGLAVLDFASEPYTRRSLTPPEVMPLPGVPGNAPALADVDITTGASSRLVVPTSALIAWAGLKATAGAPAFGVLESASAYTTDYAPSTDATCRNGDSLLSASGHGVAFWTVDPGALVPDDFADHEVALEIWAVLLTDALNNAPAARAYLEPFIGSSDSVRYTAEGWVPLRQPPGGPNLSRMLVRLGTVLAHVDRLMSTPALLNVEISSHITPGTPTGSVGIDYAIVVPARARATSPTGKPNLGYPRFGFTGSEITKTIRTDLVGLVADPTYPAIGPSPDHGLGGSPIELPPGDTTLIVNISEQIPSAIDVPDNEQLMTPIAVSARVTPRSYFLRSA